MPKEALRQALDPVPTNRGVMVAQVDLTHAIWEAEWQHPAAQQRLDGLIEAALAEDGERGIYAFCNVHGIYAKAWNAAYPAHRDRSVACICDQRPSAVVSNRTSNEGGKP